MTKGEREGLAKLCRNRERVAKNDVLAHAAKLRADFEKQMAACYSFDQDPVWKEAHALTEVATEKANEAISEQCRKLGIPPEFAPSIHTNWYYRGENAVATRRAELRKVAYARIDALAKDAKRKIERSSLEIQTKLLASGLESVEAKAFLESMPAPEQLMPPLTLDAVEAATPKQLE